MADVDAIWRPTSISMPGLAIRSATRPVPVSTDVGDAFLKPVWHDTHPNRLAREMIGLRLARALGLEAPACDVYELGLGETVRDLEGEDCDDGPALLVQSVGWAYWDGTPKGLQPVTNKRDLVGLVLLDTWLRNTDRFPPIGEGFQAPTPSDGNLQNVALAPDPDRRRAVRMLAVDFSHTLHPGSDIDPQQLGPNAVTDPGVYGLFPPFRKIIKPDHLDEFIERLDSISSQQIQGILADVPPAWRPGEAAWAAIESFLVQRQEEIRTRIEPLLAPLLGWLGPA